MRGVAASQLHGIVWVTEGSSIMISKALPRNVRWLCWLEQALVAMLRI
jgi:hypothetical protein